MNARRRSPRAIALPLAIALALAAGLALAAAPARRTVAAAPTTVVTIKNFAFSPAVVTVAPGATVRWVNQDSVAHTVTGLMDAAALHSPILQPGATFDFTFPAAGTFHYRCSIHPEMMGQVQVQGAADSLTFPETGFTVSGAFLAYWRAHGLEFGDPGVSYRESLALFGFPIGPEMRQRLEDGNTYTVQYFERARFEFHPENADPQFQVLLGQFGRHFHPADPPVAPIAGQSFFQPTGHNLGGRFRDFWQQNGGLAIFGYPLSEPFQQQLEDGKTYTVQYFERARFEAHPENQAPYDVELGQFGRSILAGK
ncbi:MAG TPA: cupredoxin family copper-binding protein [Thermomicrobiales bacterium]|nr:cupredoxin family copper-binding protein [Thermomicrobiales bacterium]